MGFVANFICFPTMQKLWISVKIWHSYQEFTQFKGGNFRDSVLQLCTAVTHSNFHTQPISVILHYTCTCRHMHSVILCIMFLSSLSFFEQFSCMYLYPGYIKFNTARLLGCICILTQCLEVTVVSVTVGALYSVVTCYSHWASRWSV